MDRISTLSAPHTQAIAASSTPPGFDPVKPEDVRRTRETSNDLDRAPIGTQDRPSFVPGRVKDPQGNPVSGQWYYQNGDWKVRNDVSVDGVTGSQSWREGNAVTRTPDGTLVHVRTNPDVTRNGVRETPTSPSQGDRMSVTVVHPDGTGHQRSIRYGGSTQKPGQDTLTDTLQDVNRAEETRRAPNS